MGESELLTLMDGPRWARGSERGWVILHSGLDETFVLEESVAGRAPADEGDAAGVVP